MDTKKVFETLPHVNEIWVKDNEFHLHPHNGGELVKRIPDTKSEEKDIKTPTSALKSRPKTK